MSKELEIMEEEREWLVEQDYADSYIEECDLVIKALQRLDRYEQILGKGRLTDRNYKNTTLDSNSCKPYLRLGQLEDIYEEGKEK